MTDGGDAMALYGVGAAWEVPGLSGAITGVGRVGAMTVDEDVPLVVTTVFTRPVLEPPP